MVIGIVEMRCVVCASTFVLLKCPEWVFVDDGRWMRKHSTPRGRKLLPR